MKFFKSPIFEVQAREVKILSSSCQPSPPHYPCSEMIEFSSNLFPVCKNLTFIGFYHLVKSRPCSFLLVKNQQIELGLVEESRKNRISENVKILSHLILLSGAF